MKKLNLILVGLVGIVIISSLACGGPGNKNVVGGSETTVSKKGNLSTAIFEMNGRLGKRNSKLELTYTKNAGDGSLNVTLKKQGFFGKKFLNANYSTTAQFYKDLFTLSHNNKVGVNFKGHFNCLLSVLKESFVETPDYSYEDEDKLFYKASTLNLVNNSRANASGKYGSAVNTGIPTIDYSYDSERKIFLVTLKDAKGKEVFTKSFFSYKEFYSAVTNETKNRKDSRDFNGMDIDFLANQLGQVRIHKRSQEVIHSIKKINRHLLEICEETFTKNMNLDNFFVHKFSNKQLAKIREINKNESLEIVIADENCRKEDQVVVNNTCLKWENEVIFGEESYSGKKVDIDIKKLYFKSLLKYLNKLTAKKKPKSLLVVSDNNTTTTNEVIATTAVIIPPKIKEKRKLTVINQDPVHKIRDEIGINTSLLTKFMNEHVKSVKTKQPSDTELFYKECIALTTTKGIRPSKEIARWYAATDPNIRALYKECVVLTENGELPTPEMAKWYATTDQSKQGFYKECVTLTKNGELPTPEMAKWYATTANESKRKLYKECVELIPNTTPEMAKWYALYFDENENKNAHKLYKECVTLTKSGVMPTSEMARWYATTADDDMRNLYKKCVTLTEKDGVIPTPEIAKWYAKISDISVYNLYNECITLIDGEIPTPDILQWYATSNKTKRDLYKEYIKKSPKKELTPTKAMEFANSSKENIRSVRIVWATPIVLNTGQKTLDNEYNKEELNKLNFKCLLEHVKAFAKHNNIEIKIDENKNQDITKITIHGGGFKNKEIELETPLKNYEDFYEKLTQVEIGYFRRKQKKTTKQLFIENFKPIKEINPKLKGGIPMTSISCSEKVKEILLLNNLIKNVEETLKPINSEMVLNTEKHAKGVYVYIKHPDTNKKLYLNINRWESNTDHATLFTDFNKLKNMLVKFQAYENIKMESLVYEANANMKKGKYRCIEDSKNNIKIIYKGVNGNEVYVDLQKKQFSSEIEVDYDLTVYNSVKLKLFFDKYKNKNIILI